MVTTYEIHCSVRVIPPGTPQAHRVRHHPYATTEIILRKADTAQAAEEVAKAMARQHRVSVVVERVERGPDLFRRQEVGRATLDADERCWFDLSGEGAMLL